MNNESKMNCNEFCHIIDSGTISGKQMTFVAEHMAGCAQCKKYYQLMYYSIEHANELLPDETPHAGMAAEIGEFVFAAGQMSKSIPLWAKITSAAAAIAIGLIIGSAVYDSGNIDTTNPETAFITDNNNPVYMAETTEILYNSFLAENEGE